MIPTESTYFLAQQFGSSTLGHLWQGTLFASLMILLAVTFGRAPARLRYNLYLLASIKFLLPSALVLTLGASFHLPVPSWMPKTLAALFDVGALFDLARRWLGASALAAGSSDSGSGLFWTVFLVVWLAGGLGLTLRWAARSRRVHRWVASGAGRPPDGELEQRMVGLRDRLGLSRDVSLRLSRELSKPGVWGVWSPTILLPESMPEILTADELDTVLLHELAHVERLDNLASRLSMALCCWLWFHPLVWWLDRRLLAERERACDERVLELSTSPGAYLTGLAKVLHFGVGGRLEGFASVGDSNLRCRMAAIRSGRPGQARLRHRLAISAAVCLLGISSLATAHLQPGRSPAGEISSPEGSTWQRAACERAYLESRKARGGEAGGGYGPSLENSGLGKSRAPCQGTTVL